MSHQTVIVLDFGSQYTQLIARRLRELSVYSEIWPPDTPVERIRDVMAELRPAVLDDYGLEAGLRWLGKRFTERIGVSTNVHSAEIAPRLPLERETALFRIAQEALNNIAKYAQAKQVTLTLEALDERIRLTIADDGSGFDPAVCSKVERHFGLRGIRTRARSIKAWG